MLSSEESLRPDEHVLYDQLNLQTKVLTAYMMVPELYYETHKQSDTEYTESRLLDMINEWANEGNFVLGPVKFRLEPAVEERRIGGGNYIRIIATAPYFENVPYDLVDKARELLYNPHSGRRDYIVYWSVEGEPVRHLGDI